MIVQVFCIEDNAIDILNKYSKYVVSLMQTNLEYIKNLTDIKGFLELNMSFKCIFCK